MSFHADNDEIDQGLDNNVLDEISQDVEELAQELEDEQNDDSVNKQSVNNQDAAGSTKNRTINGQQKQQRTKKVTPEDGASENPT